MSGFSVRRRLRAATAAAVLLSVSSATTAVTAPAQAKTTDPVTTMAGPGSPLDGMFLTYVGCDSMDAPASAPTTRINRGPDVAPIGRRSFGLVPSGPGTASGPSLSFFSLGALEAGVDVHAASGTTGASYLWVTTPDAQPGQVWRGRAALDVTPGTWQHVETATVRHEWVLVDLPSGQTLAEESATPAEFVAAHGDGPGLLVTGFGCDGQAFNLDAVRGNDRTWDFEGMALDTAILPSATRLASGDELSIAGSVTDVGGRVTGDPLVLQSRAPGASEWTDVSPLTHSGPDGASWATIKVTETQELRWLRPESEYADEGASEPVLVTVAP